ncbi:hypothetical protein D3H65_19780 [Paraflavitalea soli]|uniref:Uncharacterized protein n=1 Tax=Paraflavitalea soli TaxID=2315862 RepID=A0A3B7MSZ0_9BACT|nr:hypothetical protein [Paraflavitalea soli]AXY76086.1 hypothetical protein D3H65_19780 [Paraflavitalea soli]
MKIIASTLLLIALTVASYAQNSGRSIANNKPVFVKHWMKTLLMFNKEFWNDNKVQEIVSQIGEEEFKKVQKFSGSDNIPSQFSFPYVMVELKGDSLLYQKRNSQLKVYKIASYKHYWNNQFWGNYAILRVPYTENKNWDSTLKWDTVYFVIPEQYIEEL